MAKRVYGWKPDPYDARDRAFGVAGPVSMPQHVDLRKLLGVVYDQGELGSCTANAIAMAMRLERARQHLPDIEPSRLFIYYNERLKEGTVPEDAGAIIRDGIKSVATQGACLEAEWPYDIGRFSDTPPAPCYDSARHNRVLSYGRLHRDLTSMRVCLASGIAFVFGFSVYESFESNEVAHTGVVQMPRHGEQNVGGHAVCAVGYDEPTQRLIVRNSWGSGWGQHGHFTLPYAYVLDAKLSSDFWAIKLV